MNQFHLKQVNKYINKFLVAEALEKFERDSGAERTVKPFIKTKVFDETGSQFRNPKKPNKKQASSNSTSD